MILVRRFGTVLGLSALVTGAAGSADPMTYLTSISPTLLWLAVFLFVLPIVGKATVDYWIAKMNQRLDKVDALPDAKALDEKFTAQNKHIDSLFESVMKEVKDLQGLINKRERDFGRLEGLIQGKQ